jgi:hypothetical protein
MIPVTGQRKPHGGREMTTFTETLPATKSNPHTAITWTPSGAVPRAGLLTITSKRVAVTYLVVEMEESPPVRNFLFAKSDATPGSDKEESSYTVSVGVAGSPMGCTCKGFAYGRGKLCKHIEAAVAVLDNGWLDAPVNPEADVSNTEVPF